jgi:hypothetical protein
MHNVGTDFLKKHKCRRNWLCLYCPQKMGKWVDGVRDEANLCHIFIFDNFNLLLCERWLREEWSCLLKERKII